MSLWRLIPTEKASRVGGWIEMEEGIRQKKESLPFLQREKKRRLTEKHVRAGGDLENGRMHACNGSEDTS